MATTNIKSPYSKSEQLRLDQFKNLMVWYACEKLAREGED